MSVYQGTTSQDAAETGRGMLRSVHIDPLDADGDAIITFRDSLTAASGSVIAEFRVTRVATVSTMGGHGSFQIQQLFTTGLSWEVTGDATFTVQTDPTL